MMHLLYLRVLMTMRAIDHQWVGCASRSRAQESDALLAEPLSLFDRLAC